LNFHLSGSAFFSDFSLCKTKIIEKKHLAFDLYMYCDGPDWVNQLPSACHWRAPVSGIIFYFLFGRKRFGMLGGILSFLEEISPGLDFIPTFTIAWFIRKHERVKKTETKENKITYGSA
jgi:hypothetical protein